MASLPQKVLTWVTFVYRSLTPADLQYALAVENEDADIDLDDLLDEDMLVSSCGLFITYNRNTNEIPFIRKQFRSFISIVQVVRLVSCGE